MGRSKRENDGGSMDQKRRRKIVGLGNASDCYKATSEIIIGVVLGRRRMTMVKQYTQIWSSPTSVTDGFCVG